MRVPQFEMERWQSIHESEVELNISESGVEPLTLEELIGDPEAARRLLRLKMIYPPTHGGEALRASIATFYPGATPENVLATNGTAEANYLVTWRLIEPGDELIFMQPNYMQVVGAARAFGAEVKPLWLREELKWQPDLDDLKRLVTPRTKLIAICNPDNPTAAVLSEAVLDAVCAAAARVGAWVLSDEVYRGAELDGRLAPTCWGRYERVLCTAGMSKSFGLPGLRLGWIVGEPKIIEALWSYKDYTSIAITALSDQVGAVAMEPKRREWIFERTRAILRRQYPILQEWAARNTGLLTHVPPAAGAIAWFGYRGAGTTAELSEALRVRKSVLLVPGEQFEMPGYLRIGYGYDPEQLRRALALVDELLTEKTMPRAAASY